MSRRDKSWEWTELLLGQGETSGGECAFPGRPPQGESVDTLRDVSELRVTSWNVKYQKVGAAPGRWKVIDATAPDVVLLQEVRTSDFEAVLDVAGAGWDGFCSTALSPPVGPQKRGVCVLMKQNLIPSPPSPERLDNDACFPGDLQEGLPFKALMVDIALPDGQVVTVVSAHARPAYKFLRNRKPSFATALAAWAEACPNPVVMGIDANTPDVDHPDEAKIRLGWDSADSWPRHQQDPGALDPQSADAWGEDRLLGPKAKHLLKDAYREYHDRQGREPAFPEGPLRVSYVLRPGKKPMTPAERSKRYDHLLVSPSIGVSYCDYDMQAGVKGGSDHAVLQASLTF